MFEFLFCPQHGIFGAQNLMLWLAYGGSIWLEIQLWVSRAIAVFGRYL